MQVVEAQTIPTREAWICPDCDLIVNTAGWCPACCNTHLLNLSKILHPEEANDRTLRH